MLYSFFFGCVTLFILITITSSEYPFSEALQNGQFQMQIINETKTMLVKDNCVITATEPANLFFSRKPVDPVLADIYFNSSALIIAQQFYINHLENISQPLSNSEKIALLYEQTDSIPLAERCKPIPNCNSSNQFVEITGTCNNQDNPKWGSQFSPYGRLLPASYDDGIHTVRRSVTKQPLPSPRLIGNEVLQQFRTRGNIPYIKLNYGAMLWAQYIAHDIGNHQFIQNDLGNPGLRCCSADYRHLLPENMNYYGCMPIEVPYNDPVLAKFDMGCMHFIRTQPIFSNDCKFGPAEKSNTVSHILDQSNIYGINANVAASVRSFQSGKLLLDKEHSILAKKPNCTGNSCYFTGDLRATLYPNLALWHSIFIRFHNQIAEELEVLNHHWNDEKIFQEARRFLTAVYQHIMYDEWLPYIIGKNNAERRNLTCGTSSKTYCGLYNQSIDPSALNEFSHGAFRQFHAKIPETINSYNAENVLFRSAYLSDMNGVVQILETQYNEILRGMILDEANYDTRYPYQVRNKISKEGNKQHIGIDLLSIDISIDRDHGNAPYHVFLKMANPKQGDINDWSDLQNVFTEESILNLKKVYKSPLDIDLMVGCLLEDKNHGETGLVGSYIMEEQFYRLKYGHRFFYSFPNGENPFTEAQITEINKPTWASLLCGNTDIDEMLVNAFEVQSLSNRFVKCSSFKRWNLNQWKDLQ